MKQNLAQTTTMRGNMSCYFQDISRLRKGCRYNDMDPFRSMYGMYMATY